MAPLVLTQQCDGGVRILTLNRAEKNLKTLSDLAKVAGYARCDQAGPISVTAETDRIYLDTTADCRIRDAGWRRTIRVAKRGSRTTVVWNPWAARARQLADFGDEQYRTMVCVETANAADDRISVPPGGEHRLATTLSVEAM